MASASKTITIGSPSGYTYNLTASFNENGTTTSSNTSNVTVTATIKSNGASWSSSYNSTLIIYWHDNRENYDRQVASINIASLGVNASRSASGTINVTHNDDGNLSGYAYASFTKGGTSSYTPYTSGVTTDWTALTTIARASQPSCITYPNTTSDVGNIGDTIKIHMNRKSTAFTHTVRYGWYDKQQTIATGVTDYCQWTIPNDFAKDIPDAKKGWGTIFVDTYNGNTFIGTKSVVFWCNVSNADPTFSVAYLDTNSTTTAITGNNQQIIRSNSTLRVNITNAEAKKYATLSSAKVEINGQTYTTTFSGSSATFNIGAINVSENITAVVSVVDSRGITTSKNLAITILDWVLPTAIINLQRENNFYSETNINVNAEYSSLDNKNTISIKARYKKVTDTTYSSYTTLQDDVTTQFTLDNNYEWNVQVVLEDRLGTTTYNLVLNRGIPIAFFDRLKRSLGINCFPEDTESLEVGGENIMNRIEGFGEVCMSAPTSDWNTACGTRSGFYMGADMSNSPNGSTVAGWWWVIHLAHNDKYQRQIAFSFLNNGDMYTRIMNNGTWNSWTLVGGNEPTVLYNNSSGTMGNITLSETSNNFKYIEIFHGKGNPDFSTRIVPSETQYANLFNYTNLGSTPQLLVKKIKITGANITHDSGYYMNFTISGVTTGSANEINIYKILGYK
jgi:hypothetical protein